MNPSILSSLTFSSSVLQCPHFVISFTGRSRSRLERKGQRGWLDFLLYNPNMIANRSFDTFLELLRQQAPFLAERYGVETLEIFGSYVRAEQREDSDLDLLVTFHEAPGLLTFLAVENYLSDVLGVKVDLVMKDSLKPAIGRNILREAVAV